MLPTVLTAMLIATSGIWIKAPLHLKPQQPRVKSSRPIIKLGTPYRALLRK